MSARSTRLLASLTALVVAGLLAIAGVATAQPGYGEGGPTAELSASVSSDSITVTGNDFVPGEEVTGTVFSDPIDLGTKEADSAGAVSFTFSVRSLDPGLHRVVLEAPSGSASATFTVPGRSGDDGDSSNGSGDDGDSSNGSGDDGDSDNGSGDDGDSSNGSGDNGDSDNGSGDDGNYVAAGQDDGSSGVASDDELPFTGSNLIIPLSIAGLSLVLIGGAVLVRSRSRSKNRV